MRALAVCAAIVVAAGCGGARSQGGDGRPPVRESSFARLKHQLDLFDAARFGREAVLRAELERALGMSAGTLSGEDATDRAASAILVEADRILAEDRLDAGAQDARTLVAFDQQAPERAELWKRMMEVKAIARGRGPLAPNARLRLAGYCWRALDDAQKTIWRLRVFAASHCLYPLYDSDPEPYFSRDPMLRPPPPEWKKLVSRAVELLAPVGDWGRLERARQRVIADLQGVLGEHDVTTQWPIDPLPDTWAPVVPGATIQDWPPLAWMGGSLRVRDMIVDLQADGRGQYGLMPPFGSATGADLLDAANTAFHAGATDVLLFVRTEQTVKAPQGDHWPAGQPVAARAGTIVVSLAPLGSTAASGGREPRVAEFEGGLRLHLLVGATKWTLLSPDGVIAEVPAGDARLAGELGRVQSAFGDQVALVLVPDPKATYASVLAAAAAAAYRDGKPFFRLGLASAAPKAKAGSVLAGRIARRAAVQVTIQPEALAAHAAAARACYQDAVEKKPKLAGAVHLEAAAGAVVRTGKGDEVLTRCATQALGPAMKAQQTGAADVTFAPAGG
ncbi:MAG TPA: hypothetical protein VMZ28_09985 [Kofleriaceae bacterium]|nr:hypothetical protein [Kofleriaceae bacterium]